MLVWNGDRTCCGGVDAVETESGRQRVWGGGSNVPGRYESGQCNGSHIQNDDDDDERSNERSSSYASKLYVSSHMRVMELNGRGM